MLGGEGFTGALQRHENIGVILVKHKSQIENKNRATICEATPHKVVKTFKNERCCSEPTTNHNYARALAKEDAHMSTRYATSSSATRSPRL